MLARLFARPADLKTAVDRRARAAVVWGLLFFVALQVGFYPVSDFLPQLADGEYGHKLVHLRAQLAAKPKDQPCVVMFGSSLTGWGLDPAAMTSLKPGSPGGPVVFNFGINSAGSVVHLMCLRRLLADGIRPDLVLLETEPRFLIRHYNTVASEHYLQTPRIQFQDIPVINRYDDKAHDLRLEWRKLLWLPWYFHRLDLQNSFLAEWVPRQQRTDVWRFTDRYGWEGKLADVSPHKPLTHEQIVGAGQYHLHEIDVMPTYEPAYRALCEMVQTCRARHVPVLFVRMPDNSSMRQPPPALNERIEGFYAALRRDTGVGFIDARAWVDDSGFIDGTHLLPEGAAVFSERLGREYLEPILYRRPAVDMEGPSPRLPNAGG